MARRLQLLRLFCPLSQRLIVLRLRDIRRLCFLLLAILFAACTDYVAQMDEDFESWKAEALPSSSSMQKSSSSEEKSSSSVVESSSSIVASSSSKVLSSSSAPVSSSSEILMSSSSEKSSSSLFSESSSSIILGTMTDSRDGQTYKTVKIGSQTWMAGKLNYKRGFCFDNDTSYCTKYGRLYTWATAVGKSESECGYDRPIGLTCSLPSGNIQGICPNGWHLPSQTEWQTLLTTVGEQSGTKLKSTSGWASGGSGSDAYAFSALPVGVRNGNEVSFYMGYLTCFWSATEATGDYAYGLELDYNVEDAFLSHIRKDNAYSVRCLKG